MYFSDYKATEKTFQLVTQVAGRAGRANKVGNVVLQTYFPKHYVYNFAMVYDYQNFYKKEINLRVNTAVQEILLNKDLTENILIKTLFSFEVIFLEYF